MKPLFKWSGGKRAEIQEFKKYYPKQFEVYVEPFVGGGAVFFDLNHSNNIIADVHKEIINFYQEIKNGNSQIIYNLMEKFPNNENTYYYIRDEYVPQNTIEEAFKFFYLRKTAFRGMLRYNKKGKFNIPFGRYKTYNFDILLNSDYYKLLSNTQIFCSSFEEIFFDNEEYFYFLDPPYDSVFQDYGYCKFCRKEHERLAELFKSTKSKCLLVIGETDFIKKLYSEYIADSYEKKYSFKLHSGRIGNEINNKHLIIKNY